MEIHGANKVNWCRSVVMRNVSFLFLFRSFVFTIVLLIWQSVAGLLLLSCGGLHTVWAIFQVLYFDTSEKYRHNWRRIGVSNHTNETNRVAALLQHIAFDDMMGLTFTVVIWYVGAIIGSFLAGWYLLPSVQKKNIYVSHRMRSNRIHFHPE